MTLIVLLSRQIVLHSELLFVRMGLHDEIYAGRSTFFVEMMETASILKNGSSRSLVIIDELGRGTGTHDGSAIAYATLEHLVKKVFNFPTVIKCKLRSILFLSPSDELSHVVCDALSRGSPVRK